MKVSEEPAITGPRSLRDPRSREYAIQTIRSLKRYLESKSIDAKGVERELEEIKRHEHWQVLGFESLDAYLKAELGTTYEQLQRRLAQDLAADPTVTPLATLEQTKTIGAESGKKGGRGHKNPVANRHRVNQLSSSSAERTVRRLKRDAPDIAAALARGEYRSARAAAIAAGFVKPPTPLEKILKLLPKLTPTERRQLRARLDEAMKKRAA